MKSFLRKIIPERLLLLYHRAVALCAAVRYGFPSRDMIIIGVTGTKGKTSTANFIWAALSGGGYKVGMLTSANIRIGDKEEVNSYHMTMPGRFVIQRLLNTMHVTGCEIAIIETTSEGIKQWRHAGIQYDILVFTNLTPEHLPSHGGSFEKYKKTKGKIFQNLAQSKRKTLRGRKIPKTIIANADSSESDYFLSFSADKKITYGIQKKAEVQAEDLVHKEAGISFRVEKDFFTLNFLGEFNVYNALPAVVVAKEFEVSAKDIQGGFSGLSVIPGRMEVLYDKEYAIIVDYAHEGESMREALRAARSKAREGKVIVLLGAEGGGRDKRKRPIMGETAGKLADLIIVSNVDPYNDDPKEILEDIAQAVSRSGKIKERNLFVIEDRREGIRKAILLAEEGDVVLITGKGAEQSMIIGGKSISWDDRRVVREELAARHPVS